MKFQMTRKHLRVSMSVFFPFSQTVKFLTFVSNISDGSSPPKSAEDPKNSKPSKTRTDSSAKDISTPDSATKSKVGSVSDKAVVILKKKAPTLSDKEINPEFFQKLERRGPDDLPVEVVVPRRCLNSSNSNSGEGSEPNDSDSRRKLDRGENSPTDDFGGPFNGKSRGVDRGVGGINGKDPRMRVASNTERESSGNHAGFSRTENQSEGSFINNKGSWLAIQRQLMQLERQQAHLMNMLQVLLKSL